MTNSKATKKALFMSVISLMLCFTMLMGATFAWFTDTVKSSNNRIVAGNLKVDLVMDKEENGKYVSVANENGDIFSSATGGNGVNWEPGKTEVVYLGVKNEGSLALKYNVSLDVKDKIDGAPALVGSLEYALVDSAVAKEITSWEYAKANAVSTGDITEGFTVVITEGVLDGIAATPKVEDETDKFALVVHMKEEAGNIYQNGKIQIDMVVNATQVKAEVDSFDNTYDEDARYDTEAPIALTNALTKTDVITNSEGVVVLGENLLVDTTDSKIGIDLGQMNLDTAYQFEPNLSEEEVSENEYADWHADFVVSADKNIAGDADRIALAGYYDAWCRLNNDKWVAFTNKGMDISAGQELRLVESMGLSVSFEEICIYGNDGIGFLCGAQELNNGLEPGTTLTVELRLYEATGASLETETGKYITVGKYQYTFE